MIIVALVLVRVALVELDVIDLSGADDGVDRLIGANPEWIEDRPASLSYTVQFSL